MKEAAGPKEAALRALREAQASRPVSRSINEKTASSGPQRLKKAREAVAAMREVAPAADDGERLARAPWLAAEGECDSCDKRRASLQSTKRKKRARVDGL